jgi:hypothetical protein
VISEQPEQETESGTRKGGAIDNPMQQRLRQSNAFETEVNLFQ